LRARVALEAQVVDRNVERFGGRIKEGRQLLSDGDFGLPSV